MNCRVKVWSSARTEWEERADKALVTFWPSPSKRESSKQPTVMREDVLPASGFRTRSMSVGMPGFKAASLSNHKDENRPAYE
ncbi:hypothetical protein DSO57_1023408 [Entomophthora muscae]|uniref:Uncharacterized protein n=1 Tax=Entomophthora muscae TaxID=34485 RepID=A0ACC2U1L6_9FUNG|nr:hypothetical protein DSO57_1023408 [Entomophthora muscae]